MPSDCEPDALPNELIPRFSVTNHTPPILFGFAKVLLFSHPAKFIEHFLPFAHPLPGVQPTVTMQAHSTGRRINNFNLVMDNKAY